jgi:hypothetical protein
MASTVKPRTVYFRGGGGMIKISCYTSNLQFFKEKIKEKLMHATQWHPKTAKWKFVNLNSEALALKALVKLYKENKSVRPVIIWCISRPYKITRCVIKVLNQVLNPPGVFNLKNSLHLTNETDNLNTDHKNDYVDLTQLICVQIYRSETK